MRVSPSRTAARFDGWAHGYDGGRWVRWFRALQAITLRELDEAHRGAVLDVGCATGWAVRSLARSRPAGEFHGLDISPRMVDAARRCARGLPNTHFAVGDAQSIPHPADAFDAVLCTNSFHHYADPRKAALEMVRVTRPGGWLLVLDSMRDQFFPVRVLDMVNRAFEPSHNAYPTAAEMERCLREAGADVVERPFQKRGFLWEGKLITGVTLWKATTPAHEPIGARPPAARAARRTGDLP
jgi:ubiquinone/menaquinone biosynthesis C-methylase UbiE